MNRQDKDTALALFTKMLLDRCPALIGTDEEFEANVKGVDYPTAEEFFAYVKVHNYDLWNKHYNKEVQS